MKFKTILLKLSEVYISLLGVAIINGMFRTIPSVPFYLGRTLVKQAMNPSEMPSTSYAQILIDRIKGFFISLIATYLLNILSIIYPQNRFLNLTISNIMNALTRGIMHRAIDISSSAKNNKTVFDKEEILNEVIRTFFITHAISLSILLLSDYLIDRDDDPSKSSQTSLILGGIAGELLFHYGQRAANVTVTYVNSMSSYRKLRPS
jgi:hypothetical protein